MFGVDTRLDVCLTVHMIYVYERLAAGEPLYGDLMVAGLADWRKDKNAPGYLIGAHDDDRIIAINNINDIDWT